jgi:hypothetical protein
MGAVAAVFAALYAAHQVADHWVQTQHQANAKGLAGWRGRIACAWHVGTYTVTALVALLALAWRTDLALSPVAVAAGLAVSAGTHYLADRRTPLRWMADRLGKDAGWLERGGGLYALDQSWHVGWLFVAALIIGGQS